MKGISCLINLRIIFLPCHIFCLSSCFRTGFAKYIIQFRAHII